MMPALRRAADGMRIKKRSKNQIRKMLMALLCLAAALFLVSCRGIELENKTEFVEEYTKPQAMILIANERNRYENIYSEQIWDIALGEGETGFDKLTVHNVKQFMEQIKLLGMLAEERGITASSQERDVIRQVTDEYMHGLSDADLAYIGCDRSDVQKLYTDFFIAEKLVRSITGEVDTEISDSEVKVIRIQQIGTVDLKKAKAILKRIKIDGESFSSMASRYTETDTTDLTLMRTDTDDLISRTAFALEEGQTSNILAVGDMYYIINCVDGYAENETLERKERLKKAMNSMAVREILGPYQSEHNIKFVERFWNEIEFGDDGGSTVESFFDVYNEMVR